MCYLSLYLSITHEEKRPEHSRSSESTEETEMKKQLGNSGS